MAARSGRGSGCPPARPCSVRGKGHGQRAGVQEPLGESWGEAGRRNPRHPKDVAFSAAASRALVTVAEAACGAEGGVFTRQV